MLPPAVMAAGRPANGAKVWATHALEKVRPATPAPAQPATSIAISAARNEFEAFQIVVTGTARKVDAAVTQQPGDGIVVRLYREAMLNVLRASSSDPESKTGPWPDALVPQVDELVGEARNAFPFEIRNVSQPIWVDVFVPAGTPAGKHAGEVTITADGGKNVVRFTVEVWDFSLPATASAHSAFALAYGSIPTGFGIGASSPTFYDLRYMFDVMGLDHRVSLSRHDDGAWMDLDHFATYYGGLMSGTCNRSPCPRLAGAKLTAVEYLGPPSGSSAAADMSRWVARYEQEGWGSERLFQYTADEPSDDPQNPSYLLWAQIPGKAAEARGAGVRTLVTTTLEQATAHEVADDIDTLVPAIHFMTSTATRDGYAPFVATEDGTPPNALRLYQSCMSHDCGGSNADGTGWPSYMVDASAVRNRAMQWLLFSNRATGELYWETGYAMYAKRDPWADLWAFTGNGDGTLFYPGTPARIGGSTPIPVASIRLKLIREGMEDFEYLTLLSQVDATAALDIATTLFPDAHRAGGVSPQALLAARRDVACRILAASQKTCPAP